jgi:hypothetical protein
VALILQADGVALFGEIPTFALFKCHMGGWYLTGHDADESMLPQKLLRILQKYELLLDHTRAGCYWPAAVIPTARDAPTSRLPTIDLQQLGSR